MRIRIYSPYFPYPVTEGAHQVIYDQALGFAEHHDVELIVWKDSPEQIARKVPEGVASVFGPKLKLICWGHDETKKESQAERALRLIGSFCKRDASPGLYYYPLASDRRAELGPADLAIYHYTFAWSWLRRSNSGREQKKVVYLHNIESDLFAYRADCEKVFPLRIIHQLNAAKLRYHEADLAEHVDEYWHISRPDFLDTKKKLPQLTLPQSVRCPTYHDGFFQKRSENFLRQYRPGTPPVIGFIGGLDFDANRDSLNWILTHVCPLLQEGGFQGEFLVAGKHAPEALLTKGKAFPFFNYLGFVPDLAVFWDRLSMMLVPHVSGSGVRIKLLDSLASGIPALANDQAVERIHPDLLKSPFLNVSSDPKEWAKVILSLKDQELRKSLQRHGLDSAHRFANVYPEFSPQ